MGLLAPGGQTHVLMLSVMGISALSVGALIDPVAGLMPLIGILCLMFASFVAYFWRDPDRPIPRTPGILLSPADGRLMFVERERAVGRRPSAAELTSGAVESDPHTGDWTTTPLPEPLSFATEQRYESVPTGEESPTDVWRAAVFMSPLDVHVNRAPEAGELERIELRRGKGRRRGPFVPAMRKESEWNERVRSVFALEDGTRMEVTQIAGALARSIVPYLFVGQPVRRGQRIGMIRLGSRVDLRVPAYRYIPAECIPASAKHPDHQNGEQVLAGRTILFHARPAEQEE